MGYDKISTSTTRDRRYRTSGCSENGKLHLAEIDQDIDNITKGQISGTESILFAELSVGSRVLQSRLFQTSKDIQNDLPTRCYHVRVMNSTFIVLRRMQLIREHEYLVAMTEAT